jgi:hypothetical protein
MPCIAMGIPVVFLYDIAKKNEYRVKIINDLIGINYVKAKGVLARMTNFYHSKKIDWAPPPVELEPLKAKMCSNFQKALEKL